MALRRYAYIWCNKFRVDAVTITEARRDPFSIVSCVRHDGEHAAVVLYIKEANDFYPQLRGRINIRMRLKEAPW